MNIKTGTSSVWHYSYVNRAVAFRTAIPIFIFLKVHNKIIKQIPANPKLI